jgi:hypothetical protein
MVGAITGDFGDAACEPSIRVSAYGATPPGSCTVRRVCTSRNAAGGLSVRLSATT